MEMSKARVLKSVITLTDSAAKRIKTILGENKDTGVIGIRLSTKQRGCNGTSYVIDYDKEKQKLDQHVHEKGVNIYVESKALFSVIGTEMDFVQDRLRSEFVFNNPNATSQCGCGESFNL